MTQANRGQHAEEVREVREVEEIEKRLATLEEQFKEQYEIFGSISGIICTLIRDFAEEYGLLDSELEEKIAEAESKLK